MTAQLREEYLVPFPAGDVAPGSALQGRRLQICVMKNSTRNATWIRYAV
jgi:hypothetical protein